LSCVVVPPTPAAFNAVCGNAVSAESLGGIGGVEGSLFERKNLSLFEQEQHGVSREREGAQG